MNASLSPLSSWQLTDTVRRKIGATLNQLWGEELGLLPEGLDEAMRCSKNTTPLFLTVFGRDFVPTSIPAARGLDWSLPILKGRNIFRRRSHDQAPELVETGPALPPASVAIAPLQLSVADMVPDQQEAPAAPETLPHVVNLPAVVLEPTPPAPIETPPPVVPLPAVVVAEPPPVAPAATKALLPPPVFIIQEPRSMSDVPFVPHRVADTNERLFLQRVGAMVHGMMAEQAILPEALAEAIGVPVEQVRQLIGHEMGEVTLSTVFRAFAYLGKTQLDQGAMLRLGFTPPPQSR